MTTPYDKNDLDRFRTTMKEIEVACKSIKMNVNLTAAEAIISSLCQSHRPYQACKYIIENSRVANARFQAATAIRDAAIREWSILSAKEKQDLISFCTCYIMTHASSAEGSVESKVSSVSAQLMKRVWLEITTKEREAFFSRMKLAIVGKEGLHVKLAGIIFLESLVSEFSPSSSTSLGLPREFHEQCRKSLELDYLKTFYCWALEAAQSVTPEIMNSDSAVSEVKVCSAALRFMLQVLNWDFHYVTNGGSNMKNSIDVFSIADGQDSNSAYTLVEPGPSWHDVLVASNHIQWLLGLYGAIREKFTSKDYWMDCHIAVSARKLIIKLCTLKGTIFPSDAGISQRQHLVQLITGIIPWLDPPDVIAKDIAFGKCESEMLDGCHGLLHIAAVTNAVVFDGLLHYIRPCGTLSLLSTLMCEVVKDLMTNGIEEERWSWVARDILLDTCTTLLTETNSSGASSLLTPEGINAAAKLFALFVESEMKAASDCSEKKDFFKASVAAMDERWSSYALIARAAIELTIPLLTGLFCERFARLQQGKGVDDPTRTLEELFALLLITGHVLADGGEGETPMVPKDIQTHFLEYTETDKHPVVVLFGSILTFAQQSLDPDMRAAFFRTRLMEAIIWFLARWSCTYLMATDEMVTRNNESIVDNFELQLQHSKSALLSFHGEHIQGKIVLDVIVRISLITLVSYPGAKDLQALTCQRLLHGLVQRKNICTHLVTLDSWRELSVHFPEDRVLFSLQGSHQRSLAQTLVLSAFGMRSSEEVHLYIRNLTSPMIVYLNDTSGKSDLKSLICQHPDVILRVSCILERLRGASRASGLGNQKAIYEMGYSVLESVTKLLQIYSQQSAVVHLLLKFSVDWVEGQIIYLQPHDIQCVADFGMRLFGTCSSNNFFKISSSAQSSSMTKANTENYRNVRALLQLLSKLCTKDTVNFSSIPVEDQRLSISQVIFFGFHVVDPLITSELLKYPKLFRDNSELVSKILGFYPEMVPKLKPAAFGHVSKTLDVGLHHQDAEIVGMSLGALRALGSYHYKETTGGRDGLGLYATSRMDANGDLQDGILSRFLRSLVKLILYEDYSVDLVGAVAEPLFLLILCDPVFYQKKLRNELLENQQDSGLKMRLSSALHRLTSSNNLLPVDDIANITIFRNNLHEFLVEVRGFVRIM